MTLLAFTDSKQKDVAKKTDEDMAWETRNWEALDEILAKTKTKTPNTFFDVLNSINYDKKDLNISEYCPSYSQYMVDLGLSQHIDILPYVEHMNLYGKGISQQMHYNFYKLALPKKKRFGKWPKLEEDLTEKLINLIIMEVYTVGLQTAVRYKAIMDSKGVLNSFIVSNESYTKNENFLKRICKTKADRAKVEGIMRQFRENFYKERNE